MSPAKALELNAEPRTVLGKKVRGLRRQGYLPANVYGHAESAAIQLHAKDAERILAQAGKTHLIALSMSDGQPTTVLVKASQRHPTRGSLLHVDFFRVAMNEALRVDVPVRLVGDAPAIKVHDASMLQATSTVNIEALPADLPDAMEIDVSGLEELDSALYVRDLRPPSGVTILTDPDEMIVKMLPPTIEEEPAEAAEAEPTDADGAQLTEAEGEQTAE